MYTVGYKIAATDEISKIFRSIHRLDVKTTKGVAKLNSTFKKTGRQGGNSLDRLRVKFVKLENRAARVPKRIFGGFSKMAKRLGPIGTSLVGAFAFHEVKNAFMGTINAASDLQESTGFAQVQFGKNFQMIQSFAKGARKEIGMSRNAALVASNTFGDLFNNIGFGPDATAGMSMQLTRLSSDLSSAKNLGQKDVVGALMSGLRGETEPLSRLGIIINEATLKNKAFQMGLVKTTKKALSPQVKMMAIYASILDKTKNSQGDFARTQNNFANRMRTLAEGLENLSAKIGKVFLPYAEKLQGWGIQALDWIGANEAKIISWGKSILAASKWMFGFYGVLKISIIGLNIYDKAMKLGGIWGLIKSLKVARIAMIAFNLVSRVGPFGWIATAIGGIVLLYKKWDTFRVIFGKIAKWIWDHHPMKWMIDVIDRLIPGFKSSLSEMWTDVKDMFFKGISWIKDKLTQFAKFLGLNDLFSVEVEQNGRTNRGGAINFGKKEEKDPYEMPDFGKMNAGSKMNTGSSIKDRMNGMVANGGKQIKNININITKLIESLIIQTENLGLAESKIKALVTRAVLTAVNDANYS